MTRPDPVTAAAAAAEAGFAERVIVWQQAEGRHDLPWQRTRDPYRVWLSEIMLQQTQVATVLGYYARFLERFPDVRALAAAPLDDVLAAWSGLGYYSRARHLHRCAQVVAQQHGGHFPPSAEVLATLPGIGRSTAAAIAAFCFDERVAILDGNVKRVLGRVLAFDGDLARPAAERALWDEATRLLPEAGIAPYTQGLMDLGATVCTRSAPACGACPVRPLCRAADAGEPTRYPVKTRALRRGRRETLWVSLAWRDRLWLVQRPATGIWAGLWSLPEFTGEAEWLAASAGWPGDTRWLPSFTHVLTHLDWRLHPLQHRLPDGLSEAEAVRLAASLPSDEPGRWWPRDALPGAGLPAALRKLLPEL